MLRITLVLATNVLCVGIEMILLVASLLAVVVHFWDTPACVEPKGCTHYIMYGYPCMCGDKRMYHLNSLMK